MDIQTMFEELLRGSPLEIGAALAAILMAIAFLLRSFGAVMRTLATAGADWMKTRNDVRLKDAELERLRAEVFAQDQDAENKERAMLLQLLAGQIENGKEVAKVLATMGDHLSDNNDIQERFAIAMERWNAVAEKSNEETRLLRMDFKDWPKLIDTSLGVLDTHIRDMTTTLESQGTLVELLINAAGGLRDDHKQAATEHKWTRVVLSAVYEKVVGGPPPPYPGEKITPMTERTDADGAKHDATVDLPEQKRDVA